MDRRRFLSGLTAAGLAASPGAAQSRPVRIGIVGGRFGATFQWHLDPNARVEAVCDIRKDRLQALSEVYRCPNTFDDFRRMLAHPAWTPWESSPRRRFTPGWRRRP